MGFRKPDLAGAWYPGVEKEIKKTIEGYISKIKVPDEKYYGKGGIVPHAGWYFSGKVAFWVLYSISKINNPELIFLFGMHLPPHSPDYIFIDDGYETPLGRIPVNQEASKLLYDSFDFIKEDAVYYSQDNTIEIQLPFLKYLFPEASIVTVGVSPTERASTIGEKAVEISQELGLNSCYIGSTDLTHYGPNYDYAFNVKNPVKKVEREDKKVINKCIKKLDAKGFLKTTKKMTICGAGPIAIAMIYAKYKKAEKIDLLRYYNSGNIVGDFNNFVGYGSIVFE